MFAGSGTPARRADMRRCDLANVRERRPPAMDMRREYCMMGRSVSRLWWRRKLLVCASSNPQATLWVVLLLAAIVAGWHQYGREKVRVACTGLRRARSYFKYLRSDATKIGALIRTCFLSPCHAKYLLYLHQSYVHEPQISLGCVLPFALFHIFLGEGPLTRRCGFEAMHCVLHD